MTNQISVKEILFTKLHDKAVVPQRNSSGAAGYDLWIVNEPERITDEFGDFLYHCKTGLAVEIPPGYFLAIYPRSSLGKRGFTLSNCVGVIDEDYRGEIQFYLRPSSKREVDWNRVGKRFVQAVLQQYHPIEWKEVEKLSETERGIKGFGSSGR
jgi:dUTP pyrophosphatase